MDELIRLRRSEVSALRHGNKDIGASHDDGEELIVKGESKAKAAAISEEKEGGKERERIAKLLEQVPNENLHYVDSLKARFLPAG